ncbi:MAG: DUF502 domain-containing protein [Armatimonadota bacterium]|nr:DUF502 domain-containing protein [Armatimonadota bacterium]MCX7777754.1 DUF502 domain-containing protein [Armatimonadota bacterium]MDW8026192.1 DUF502 domain-containing protein [Armatimonadota bacterium]
MRFRLLRRYFLAGLAVLLPAGITVGVLAYITQLIYKPLAPLADKWVSKTLHIAIPGIGLVLSLVLVFIIIVIVGFIGSTVIGGRIIKWWDSLLAQLPIVRIIYPPARQIVQFFTQPQARLLGKPVLVSLPRAGCHLVGFLTGYAGKAIEGVSGKRMVTVFVPSTPTPLTGFTLIVPEENVIHVDISFEDALKLIVSGGAFKPGAVGLDEAFMIGEGEPAAAEVTLSHDAKEPPS